jgi:hypothetical protein
MTKGVFRKFANAPINEIKTGQWFKLYVSVHHFVYLKYKDTQTGTNSRERTPSWEISRSPNNRFLASLNPEISLPCHNSPPFVLSWATWIQTTPSHPIPSMSNLITSYHPQVRLQIGRFPSDFDRVCICCPHTCYMPRPSHPSCLENPTAWQ